MAPAREPFVWHTEISASDMDNPQQQLKASLFEGKLTVEISGKKQEVDLPEDAFTDGASAHADAHQLVVTVPRRDPEGPAMQEKRMFNPDRHPVELDITLSKELMAKVPKPSNPIDQPGGKTPAQLTLSEVNSALYGGPTDTHYKMPEVNMGSSIVTAMPVMDNTGGAVDTVSQGETVVAVPGMVGSRHVTGVGSESGGAPAADEIANKMRDTAIHDQPPKGDTVLFGQKERQNEAKYDESAATPHTGTAAAGGTGREAAAGEAAGGDSRVTGYGEEAGSVPVAGGATAAAAEAPAGDDDDAHLKTIGARGDKVKADFTKKKVGMEYEELTAADRYVTAESADNEPLSSVKQPGDKCDLCACNPCQCGKMRKTGGTGNDPFELTAPEQKRGGKPASHSKHWEETGRNAHDARDYRAHAAQVDASHVGIGAKLSDYQGNVPEGVGDFSDPEYAERLEAKGVHGATHTGGAAIEMGGPGQRHTSDAVGGGPVKGGHKTTFTTLG